MAQSLRNVVAYGMALMMAACTRHHAPPLPGSATAPTFRGIGVLLLPVQEGAVPSPDSTAHHWPIDRAALDGEIAYWMQQGKPVARWILPATIDRSLARNPGLEIKPRALAVGIFQHAQVKRIGDPLFGDLRRLAGVFDAEIAVIPVAAEYIGATPEVATVNIATAVINAVDGTVLWFGVITGSEKGAPSEAAVAAAAQAFASAFGEKKKVGEN